MAAALDVSKVRPIKITENTNSKTCFYCKGNATTKVQCGKCCEIFHPSCFKRAQEKKKSLCRHEEFPMPIDEDTTESSKLPDKEALFRKIIEELESKNRILQENCELWRAKALFLGEKVEKYEKFGYKTPNKQNVIDNIDIDNEVTDNGNRNVTTPGATPTDLVPAEIKDNQSQNANITSNSQKSIKTKQTKTKVEENISTKSITTKDVQEALKSLNLEPRPDRGSEPELAESTHKQKQNVDKSKEDDWITVGRHRRNRGKMEKPLLQNDSRPPHIKGSNQVMTKLQVAQRLQWIFVSGLAPKMESNDILDFLKVNKIGDGCTCEKMQTKNKQVSSFKLGVPYGIKEKVMDAELWPYGVRVNHFLNLQRRQIQGFSPERGTQLAGK